MLFLWFSAKAVPLFALTQNSNRVSRETGSTAIPPPERSLEAQSKTILAELPPQADSKGVIKVIRIVGVTKLEEVDLLKLFTEYKGKEITYSELKNASDRIIHYYSQRGTSVKASVLNQDISGGVVLYQVTKERSAIDWRSDTLQPEERTLIPPGLERGALTRIMSRTSAHGSYYLIKPALTVSEEYNDNIFESKDHRKADLITHVTPSLGLEYHARFWDWNISYSPTYRHYLLNNLGDELIQSLSLVNKTRLIDNFLYLDISDSYSHISIDGNRDYQYTNQTDANIFKISPSIVYQLNPRWAAKGGYRYVNRWYDYAAAITNQEQGVFLNVTRETGPKSSVFMAADASQLETSTGTFFSRFTHGIGFTYKYADGSSVIAQGGYSVFFPQNGDSTTSPYWNLGWIHTWRTYIISVNSGVSFDTELNLNASERQYINFRLAKTYKRGAIGLSSGYAQIRNSQTGVIGSRWFNVGTDATYEFNRRATVTASMAADRYLDGADTSYHNSFNLGLRYELYYDLFLTGAYNHIAHSENIFSPVGSIEVNRIMLSITKRFY